LSVKWRNGFDPDVVLGKLKEIRTLDGEKVSFSAFEYNEYIQVLKSMIDIDECISPEVAHGLIVTGFHEAAKKQDLTGNNVINAVKKAVREHLGKPNKPYWLLTTLNININNDLPRYSINGCRICFYKYIPKKYRNARNSILSEVSSWLIDKDESFSYYVVIHVSHKTAHEAVERMLDAIDLLRGIWNLHINESMVLTFGGRKKPVNKVTLGALHTLHNQNGAKVSETFWYDPEHYKNHSKVDLSGNSYKTLKFTKDVRKALRKNSYGKDVESAIIRYARALDSQDYNAVFLKLWSILECLTNTLKDSYDKTIRRVAFQYSDHEYNRQVLEHLRHYRNRSVHLGTGENDIDTHVYQLKGYVEQLLRFHIANYYKFESITEAARFMDLQPDKEALKKQIELCRAGIKFMGG